MKKILSSRIFLLVVSAIVFTSIGVVAGTITASEVTYNDMTLAEAIDDLYTIANKEILNKYRGRFRVINSGNTTEAVGNFGLYDTTAMNYKYFKIIALNDTNDTTAYCNVKGWSNVQSKSIALELNTEYEIFSDTDGYKFTEINVYTKSTTAGQTGRCQAIVELYNK